MSAVPPRVTPPRAAPPALPAVGQALGPYRLEALLGEGAVGSVFRARHEALGRPVAIKVLHPDLRERHDVVERFFNEARAVNRIRHPGIVAITDFRDDGPLPYLVMELLEGQSLATLIAREAPLPVARVLPLALALCDALAAVHDAGIVHRDLKADNLFLVAGEPPTLKLLDFGVSKFLAAEEVGLTGPGELMGTPQIMAPEQIRGTAVDHRVDIYAVGVLLYELLTATPPFESLDLVTLLHCQVHEPAPPLHTRLDLAEATALPAALEAVVLQCLAKDPADRPADLRTLGRLLEAAGRGVAPGARPKASPTAPRARLGVGLGLGLIGVVGLGSWLATRDPDPVHQVPARAVRQPPAASGTPTLPLKTVPPGAAVYRRRDGRFLGRTPLAVVAPRQAPEAFLLRLAGHRAHTLTLGPGAVPPGLIHLAPDARPETHPPARARPRRPGRHREAPVRPRSAPVTPAARREGPRPGDRALVDPFGEPPP